MSGSLSASRALTPLLLGLTDQLPRIHRHEPWNHLEEFVADHGPHGTLTGDATAQAWNGYLLTVVCCCDVQTPGAFERGG